MVTSYGGGRPCGSPAPGFFGRAITRPYRQMSKTDLVKGQSTPCSVPAPSRWNDNAAPVPTAIVPELFQAQARRAPDAVAVVFGAEELTYAELDCRANRLAWHLQDHGVGSDVLVGICLPRGLDMIVAVLGVLKAGGAYVPLDPAYPGERLQFMLADTATPVVITTCDLAERLPRHDAAVVRLDTDRGAIAGHPTTTPPCDATPDSLACAIYTSGSTGTPKTVAIEHLGITNHLSATSSKCRAQQFYSILLLPNRA